MRETEEEGNRINGGFQHYAVASCQNGKANNDTFVLNRVNVTTPGATAVTSDRGDEFNPEGFDGTSLAEAIANEDYVSFALEIEEGQQAEDLPISFDLWRDGADSATHYARLTSADGFATPIGQLAFAAIEHGINLGLDYSGGEYGVGNAQTLSGLLDFSEGVEGVLGIRLTGYSDGQSLAGSTHLVAARVEGLFGLAGDFDGDGDVDGADFLQWQRDGLSAAELRNWQYNYGNIGLLASAAAVPEPTTQLLTLLSLVARLRIGQLPR